MTQATLATEFKDMHNSDTPLVLYNIWDAGGAKTLADAGAQAIATGSWAMAAAHGYQDGEFVPLDFVLHVVARIVDTVDIPVTVDFEGGYASDRNQLALNTRALLNTGAVGINFEDQIVGDKGLYETARQAERIETIRSVADQMNLPLFINARTDLFLGTNPAIHTGLVEQAIARAHAYAAAGADGFFIPGLTDPNLIKRIVETVAMPVNVMLLGKFNSVAKAKDLGVARISFGPGPYAQAQTDLAAQYQLI